MTMRWLVGGFAVGLVCLGGCKSAFVEADVKNDSGAAVTLLEVDYPSASFGKESLEAGAKYHYRFKVQGQGPTKILWTDAAQKEHTVAGPALKEGQEGSMSVTITGQTAMWDVTGLKP